VSRYRDRHGKQICKGSIGDAAECSGGRELNSTAGETYFATAFLNKYLPHKTRICLLKRDVKHHFLPIGKRGKNIVK
jgi:hypothetical protein